MTEFDYVLPRLDAGDEDDKSVAFFIRRLQAEIERLKSGQAWLEAVQLLDQQRVEIKHWTRKSDRLQAKSEGWEMERKSLEYNIERLKKNEETLVENLRRERDTRYGEQR